MSSNNDQTAFTITRQFKQPLDVIWEAWSEPDQLKQWWGPQGCSVDVNRFEFRPGGFFHYTMNFAGLPKMWGRFNYREIAALKHIVWLNSFANEHGGIARAPFSEICPLEIQNTVTFTEQAGQTTVTLHAEPFGATDAERQYFEALKPSLEQGYGGTFEQLGDYLLRG